MTSPEKQVEKRLAEFDAEYQRTRIFDLLRKGIEGPLDAVKELVADIWVLHKRSLSAIESGEAAPTRQMLNPAARAAGTLETLVRMRMAISKYEEGDSDSDGGTVPPSADAPDSAMLASRCQGFFGTDSVEDAGGEDGAEAGDSGLRE